MESKQKYTIFATLAYRPPNVTGPIIKGYEDNERLLWLFGRNLGKVLKAKGMRLIDLVRLANYHGFKLHRPIISGLINNKQSTAGLNTKFSVYCVIAALIGEPLPRMLSYEYTDEDIKRISDGIRS